MTETRGPADRPPPEPAATGWLADVRRLDLAVYRAVAATPTPAIDTAMSRLSRSANKSRLWMATAAVVAATGGRRGRRAAAQGMVCVAVSSAVVNLGIKRIARRERPERDETPQLRHVPMPGSLSFPSGHAASAFAFATGVGHGAPALAVPLQATAAVVAYSRVHTGVHYPGDVLVGALIGTLVAQVTTRAVDRRLGPVA